MSIEQTLQSEIQSSKRWIECTQEDSTYKRDSFKRIELINWVPDNMKNPDTQICRLIEYRMKQIIEKVNKIDDAIEAEPLHSEIRILNWIFYVVSSNDMKLAQV